MAWCAKEFPNISWRKELAKLKDNEFKRPYSDWNRTFRNWIRNAQDYTNERTTSKSEAKGYTAPEAREPEKTELEITIQSARAYGLQNPESYDNVNDLKAAIQAARFGGST